MEGKLVRRHAGDYKLYVNDEVFAQVISSPWKKLSLKNCQTVENGYDLEEISSSLRKEFEIKYNTGKGIPLKGGGYIIRGLDYQVGVIDGFQKALELLGDKKFSEEDMVKMFFNGRESLDKALVTAQEAKSVIQSLQQTEWDVEIRMGTQCRQINCVNKGELVKSKIVKDGEVPMLDKDGCLILKRKV